MQILHLAFEDHRRPGSGGGSLRNFEINRRLAADGFQIEVVTARFPGAQDRTEHGVEQRHTGLPLGYAPSLLSYQAALPAYVAAAIRRRRPDLIVEDFAPVFSSLGVGYWTSVPTVGQVQGLFAAEKARLYHLPAELSKRIEALGTRSHPHLIAVSEDVREKLLKAAPSAEVFVLGNGVDLAAASAARERAPRTGSPEGHRILFMGRLEIDQKGLDVLLLAMTMITTDTRLVLAGEGRDRARLRDQISSLDCRGRVEMVGTVSGSTKWDLLAQADLLVLPSRYETFGISALEALACGTPVVASDLACLRELVPTTAGRLVRPDDAPALAAAIDEVLDDPDLLQSMRNEAPAAANGRGWDAVAARQGAVYRLAAGSA